MSALHELARAVGLDPQYTSWRGEAVCASDDTLLATLRAMAPDLGVNFERLDDADAALATVESARWCEIVPPVVVGWSGSLRVPFRVPAESDTGWELEIATEAGRTVHASGRLVDLPADSHARARGIAYCVRRASIDVHGEHGYHRVKWRAAGEEGEALGVAAPERAWGGPGSGDRRWGVFAPVHGLASAHSGQTGDLRNLRRLFDAVGLRGGTYVSTLPILAAFLDEPCVYSPYSPASRLYWNELYLDLASLAAEANLEPPTAPPIVPGTLIDYREQYRWRRRALDDIARAAVSDPARRAAIDAWAIETGAYDYAAFRAIGETARAGWRQWPTVLRDQPPPIRTRTDAIGFGADGARVDTHVVAQWAMQHQLEALASHPVRLYLDLPVGVSHDAYEVWRHRSLFVTSVSAGAPPDALFLGGQNWSLPPLSPIALRRDHYRYFIRCVRHHMRVAGMLRVDHVMGLFRLYCIPDGRPATDGVYLRYEPDELLAVIALESHRARCAVVGEDLGTVPEAVRPAMARHGMYRLHVGQWHFPVRAGDAHVPSPPASVAALNTHDMPTFAGWWRGADIADRLDLGLITHAQETVERIDRDRARAALLAYAHPADDHLAEVDRAPGDARSGEAESEERAPGDARSGEAESEERAPGDARSGEAESEERAPGDARSGEAESEERAPGDARSGEAESEERAPGDARSGEAESEERAMISATTELAVGPAEVVLVALDDLALDPIPHNVPGTTTDRPNWQRRVAGWADALDELRAPPAAAAAINAVVAARSPKR